MPFILCGRDVLCLGFEADSTSELAVTYIIPALQKIHADQLSPQILILLQDVQMAEEMELLIHDLGRGVRVRWLVASGSLSQSVADQQVIIGAPENISNMIANGSLPTRNLRMVVLHELRPCTESEHLAQRDVLSAVPQSVQCVAFCAGSLAADSRLSAVRRLMRDEVVCLLMNPIELSMEHCQHFYLGVEREEWKVDTVCDIIETLTHRNDPYVIYCNTRRKAEFVLEQLQARDLEARILHADMARREQELVAREHTQAERGINTLIVQGGTLYPVPLDLHHTVVINFDMPTSLEGYLERLGQRPSRLRRRYIVMNFVMNPDVRFMKEIERHYHIQLEELPLEIDDLLW